MYSETNDFLEKDTAYSVMLSRISRFFGKDAIDALRGILRSKLMEAVVCSAALPPIFWVALFAPI